MPLSPPVGRQLLHTRRVTCQGFFREDGLWDIEGRITDEKTYQHSNEWRGPLGPGDFVHDMSIRLTLDHRFTIVNVEAVTDKSPYQVCGNVAPDFRKLIGLRIGGGFHRAVRERLGGVHGCTHIVEMLQQVATLRRGVIITNRDCHRIPLPSYLRMPRAHAWSHSDARAPARRRP